jgi:hypothetical protein
MSGQRVAAILQLAREAVVLGIDFGPQSLEALSWVARTVEASVYVPRSLVRTPSGLRFRLANAPLRVGAFSGVRLVVDGTPIAPERVRVRVPPDGPWIRTSELGAASPLALDSGTPTEFEAEVRPSGKRGPLLLRLEFQSVAIPPLVWLEMHETPREDGAP